MTERKKTKYVIKYTKTGKPYKTKANNMLPIPDNAEDVRKNLYHEAKEFEKFLSNLREE